LRSERSLSRRAFLSDAKYALADKGHDPRAIQAWLDHRSIASTAVYTALAANRFKDLRRD
jgi:site-specific recombinase XerD